MSFFDRLDRHAGLVHAMAARTGTDLTQEHDAHLDRRIEFPRLAGEQDRDLSAPGVALPLARATRAGPVCRAELPCAGSRS